MYQNGSILPVPAPAAGATSTGEGAAHWGLSEQNAAADLLQARSALHTEVLHCMLKCKACKRVCSICSGTSPSCKHKQGTPAPQQMLPWRSGRWKCGSTTRKGPDEQQEPSHAESQWNRGRFQSFTQYITADPRHQSSTLACSNATAKAVPPLHRAFGFSNLFITQLCSGVVYSFAARKVFSSTSLWLDLLPSWITMPQNSGEEWRKERGQVSQLLIDIY